MGFYLELVTINNCMSIEELTRLAKERPMTEEDVKAFEERCKERQKEFDEWDAAQRHFDYNFRYTI
jgi:hypothetical protein